MRGNLWSLTVVIVLVAVLLPAAGFAYTDSAQTHEAEEQHTIYINESVTVDEADTATHIYDNETVTHDGTELVAGEDYEFDIDTGELLALTEEYDDEEVTIVYSYDAPDETTQSIAAVVGTIGEVAPLLVLVTGVAALLGIVFTMGGDFGGR